VSGGGGGYRLRMMRLRESEGLRATHSQCFFHCRISAGHMSEGLDRCQSTELKGSIYCIFFFTDYLGCRLCCFSIRCSGWAWTIDISWVDWAYKSSTCDVKYCRHSAAIYIMVVKFRNTICPPPPRLSLHRRAALSSNSNGTRSVYSRKTQKGVYIVRCLWLGQVCDRLVLGIEYIWIYIEVGGPTEACQSSWKKIHIKRLFPQISTAILHTYVSEWHHRETGFKHQPFFRTSWTVFCLKHTKFNFYDLPAVGLSNPSFSKPNIAKTATFCASANLQRIYLCRQNLQWLNNSTT
jgi:hypothetical protein